MSGPSTIRCALAAALAALAAATPAGASPTQESIIQDDPLLLSAKSRGDVDEAFARFRSAGVDRVRVSVFWFLVAPASSEQQRPAGASYPAEAWATYDRIVRAAARADMPLLFSVTGPAPAWATPGERCEDHPGRGCGEGVFRPDPREFARFVEAAGKRYPSVSTWSIWNEPNYPSSLKPVWEDNRPASEEEMVPAAPRQYRELVDAAWSGLSASGHANHRILIGETAPRGGKNPRKLGNAMMPAEFARELYCVDGNLEPWTGAAARERGCPETAEQRSAFRSEHPGLFRSQGWAHHPYSLARGRWRLPTWRHELADNVAIGNLSHLTRTLDRSAAAWGGDARKSIWITEYGYQTTPPDPVAGVPPARHGPLYAWGEELAYRDPRVASFAQFLLLDDGPVEGFSGTDPRRWVTWQSGLFDAADRPKSFERDYRLPLHLDQGAGSVRVFGGMRSAPSAGGALRGVAPGLLLEAVVQHAPDGGAWRLVREVQVRNPRGYMEADVGELEPGRLRIVWLDPVSHRLVTTRTARVR
ncbi:MAG TPA: hypothetical protein VFD31_10630 [Thermoleophilaceae bacterium]|nr:hypothetical protein [Thermoleophilaceae bacterium]